MALIGSIGPLTRLDCPIETLTAAMTWMVQVNGTNVRGTCGSDMLGFVPSLSLKATCA